MTCTQAFYGVYITRREECGVSGPVALVFPWFSFCFFFFHYSFEVSENRKFTKRCRPIKPEVCLSASVSWRLLEIMRSNTWTYECTVICKRSFAQTVARIDTRSYRDQESGEKNLKVQKFLSILSLFILFRAGRGGMAISIGPET